MPDSGVELANAAGDLRSAGNELCTAVGRVKAALMRADVAGIPAASFLILMGVMDDHPAWLAARAILRDVRCPASVARPS